MKAELKEKLESIVELVDKLMVEPDVEVEYCIPDVVTTSDSSDVNADPYILVKYSEDTYVERKIRLKDRYLRKTAEDVANLVLFSIEQFIAEIGAIRYEQE